MVSFARLLAPALCAILFTSTTGADSAVKRSTYRTHYIGASRSVKLEAYHPQSIYEVFGVDGVDPLPEYGQYPRSSLETGGAAVNFLASRLSVSEDSIHLRRSAQGQMANHAFLVQKINGVPVANAVANVAFNNNNGKVSSFSSSFVEHSGAADINPAVSRGDAIITAEMALDGTYNGHPTKLEFFVQPDGFAALTHVIQIRNKTAGTWYEAFVDAHNNTLLSVTDFVRKSSYHAIPFMTSDPTEIGFEDLTDPQNMTTSPLGWHQEFDAPTNQTDGNNAIAYTGLEITISAVETSDVLNFDYVPDFTQDPSTATNVQAAITNAFYVINSYHDFAYSYGFTEALFNMQTNNFNKTGDDQGFDRVLVSVQDPRGLDGADFAIVPDGQSCEMMLYIFTDFTPHRDSAFQNDILLHECQHGANNRMTGGGTASCYQTAEAMGVDEGYADAMADVMQQSPDAEPDGYLSDFIFGKDASNSPNGLRSYPYSVNTATNPLTYGSLAHMVEYHQMGQVWANILHNVYMALADVYYWTWLIEDPSQTAGNSIFFHLVFDSLIDLPCNPTFTMARDAMIQADAVRYNHANECLLWKAFASKGLGYNADNYVDDYSVLPSCT